jgi:hypothetical protein
VRRENGRGVRPLWIDTIFDLPGREIESLDAQYLVSFLPHSFPCQEELVPQAMGRNPHQAQRLDETSLSPPMGNGPFLRLSLIQLKLQNFKFQHEEWF